MRLMIATSSSISANDSRAGGLRPGGPDPGKGASTQPAFYIIRLLLKSRIFAPYTSFPRERLGESGPPTSSFHQEAVPAFDMRHSLFNVLRPPHRKTPAFFPQMHPLPREKCPDPTLSLPKPPQARKKSAVFPFHDV